MLAIFGFRRNRNQSNQEPESEAEVYGDGSHAVATAPAGFVHAQNPHTQEDVTPIVHCITKEHPLIFCSSASFCFLTFLGSYVDSQRH